MKSVEITKEIRKLEERRSALLADQHKSQAAMETARAGLIEGKNGADKVIAAQNEIGALKGAVEFLSGQINEQQALLAAAQQAEDEAERQATIVRLRAERDATIAEFGRIRAETHAHLLKGAGELVAALERFIESSNELHAYAPKPPVDFAIPDDETLLFGGAINSIVTMIANKQVELPAKAKAA